MLRLVAKLFVVAIVIAAAPSFSDSIVVGSFGAALFAALIYGILFMLIGWILTVVVGVLSIVPGMLTLGLFFLLVPAVVNAILLKMTAGLVGSFQIRTWGAALLLSLVLGAVNWFFESKTDRSAPR